MISLVIGEDINIKQVSIPHNNYGLIYVQTTVNNRILIVDGKMLYGGVHFDGLWTFLLPKMRFTFTTL